MVRGCFRIFERDKCAENPPHPDCTVRCFASTRQSDLSPQAGRGKERQSAQAPAIAGLRHVGTPAAALAAERLGALAHQFECVEARCASTGSCDAQEIWNSHGHLLETYCLALTGWPSAAPPPRMILTIFDSARVASCLRSHAFSVCAIPIGAIGARNS